MNILAVGANPDDVEIGAAGTLARHVNEGNKVYILHMINTGYNDPITKRVWRSDVETRKQAERAATIIGAEMHMLNFRDRHVPFNEKSIILVEKFIKEHSIDVVYTHWGGDSHQDHINTHRTVMAATRYLENVYLYEQIPVPRMSTIHVEPKYYVDITDYVDIKLEAIRSYEFLLKKYGDDFIEGIKALARYRGTQCGRKYAEAFEVVKIVR